MFGPANLFDFQMLWALMTCSLDNALGVACATCRSSVYTPLPFLVGVFLDPEEFLGRI